MVRDDMKSSMTGTRYLIRARVLLMVVGYQLIRPKPLVDLPYALSEEPLEPYWRARGYLFLNMGEWDGEQIVPREWVEEATRKHVDATMKDGYGYQCGSTPTATTSR